MDAAERLLGAQDIVVTMDAIAGAAELSKGTLYLYFKSREQLMSAVAARTLDAGVDDLARAIEQPGSFEAVSRAAMERIARHLDEAAGRLGAWVLLSDAALEHVIDCSLVLRDRLLQIGFAELDAGQVATMAASWALGLVVASRANAALALPGVTTIDELARGGAQLLVEGWRAT